MESLEFGEYLKALRKNKGLSLSELSRQSEVSQPYLSLVESGKRGVPSPDSLRKLADPLGISFSDLLMKAGHVNQEEWSTAFIDEGFHIDEDTVYKRVVSNKDTGNIELKTFLLTAKPLSYNGHKLTEKDRLRVLEMLPVLFPEYKKEP